MAAVVHGDLEGRASSDATAQAKRLDLECFLRYFLDTVGADRVELWTRAVTAGYLKYLEVDLERKSSTVNRHLATLRHAARWIESQRPFLAGVPTDSIAELEPDEPEWRGLSPEQLREITATTQQLLKRGSEANRHRNYALFVVLLHAGLRISELLAVGLDQYRSDHFADVKRKGKKRSRKVFLSREAREALDAYLENERRGGSRALFLSRSGRPLRRGNAHDALKRLQDLTNERLPREQRFTWSAHDLRHTFLRRVAERYGVRYARELSGHASDRYIWRYVQPSDDEKARALERLF